MLVLWGQDVLSHLQGAQSSPSPALCPDVSPELPHPLSIPEAAEGLGLLHGEGKKSSRQWDLGFYFILSKYL